MGDNNPRLFGLLRAVVDLIGQRFPSFKYWFNSGKSSRNIVRRIGSWLPLPPAPRVYINIPSDSILFDTTPYGSFYEDDYLPEMHKEHSSLCLSYPHLLSTPQMTSSTPENQRMKIHHLEKELTDLKLQVAQILETMPTSDYGSMVSVWLGNQPVLTPSPGNPPSAPPQSPPTPPPLPPPCVQFESTPVKVTKGRRRCAVAVEPSNEDKKSPAAILGDVLKQLSTERPQLRHVKRSPGGSNPEKKPKVLDPSDILSKVLRQRFEAFHPNTSDTDGTDTSINDSEFMNEVLTSPASLV